MDRLVQLVQLALEKENGWIFDWGFSDPGTTFGNLYHTSGLYIVVEYINGYTNNNDYSLEPFLATLLVYPDQTKLDLNYYIDSKAITTKCIELIVQHRVDTREKVIEESERRLKAAAESQTAALEEAIVRLEKGLMDYV